VGPFYSWEKKTRIKKIVIASGASWERPSKALDPLSPGLTWEKRPDKEAQVATKTGNNERGLEGGEAKPSRSRHGVTGRGGMRTKV